MLQISLALDWLLAFVASLRAWFSNRTETSLEILALRAKYTVLKRKRPLPSSVDRLFSDHFEPELVAWANALLIVQAGNGG
jgi:hypothetical protein